jgi:FkbM family methyltransferase
LEPDYRRSPLVLVDVGASGGVQPRWREVAPWLRVVGFDADNRAPVGPDRSFTYLRSALYRERARVPFHLTRRQETSSVFVANRPFVDRFPEAERFDVVETVELDADTLDAQLRGVGITDIDFLKIDAQGCELAILEGAADCLSKSALGLELEVEFAEVYRGQPLFTDVDALVRRHGFVLFDLQPYYWKRRTGVRLGGTKGQLVFGEALYFKDLDGLAGVFAHAATEELRRIKLLHMLAVCWVYGYLDFAAEILVHFAIYVTAEERERLERSLAASPRLSARLPAFPGRARVAGAVAWLSRALRLGYRGWGDAGPGLGNR